MKLRMCLGTCLTALMTCGVLGVALRGAEPKDSLGWSPQAAATYLDSRATFWTTWPNAARDHGTFCISCHTTLPFAIARPALRGLLGESGPGAAESKILENLLTRARGYRQMGPFQPD